jgi:hypothetical protein
MHTSQDRPDLRGQDSGPSFSISAPWYHLKPSSDPEFQLTAKILADKFGCGGGGMMVDLSAHPHAQHIQVARQLPIHMRSI